jgi:signal transduction histidine kinase
VARDVASEETVVMHGSPRAKPTLGGEGLQTIIDSLADGLAVVDVNGKFVQFNPSAEAILALGPTSEPPESWPKTYGLFLPDMRTPYPVDQLPLIRALRGEQVTDIEMYARHPGIPDGKWLRVRAAPIRDARGSIVGAAALFRDETTAKKTDFALEAERRYLRYLITTQDRDRQLAAFDLHDGVVQTMTGALMRLESLQYKYPDFAAGNEDYDTAVDLVREAIEETRRMIGGLRPPVIDERGIVGAVEYLIENQCRRENLKVDFIHDTQVVRLSALQESTIFRIVQEALHNAARHSDSPRARVCLRRRDDVIEVEITDWGKGFDVSTAARHRYGIRGIEERARLLQGNARIESRPGAGTTICVTLPLNATAPEMTDLEP